MHGKTMLAAMRNLAVILALGLTAGAEAKPPRANGRPDPKLTMPWCAKAPTIDGVLQPDEWTFAAALSLFEAYPGTGVPQVMRQEQPIFYIFRDDAYLYLAMDCVESNTNTVVAACMQHDNMRIIGDDCVEMMIAPAAGAAIQAADLPVYYFAMNAIGTVWDAKFFPKFAETHNSWESGIEIRSVADGTRWTCEIRLPFAAIRKEPPREGEVWRMNFDRTYSGYSWSAWNASGGLNDARVGGDVTFDRTAAAVRLLSAHPLTTGVLGVNLEIANGTDKPQTVSLSLAGAGGPERAENDKNPLAPVTQTVTVPAGEVRQIELQSRTRLHPYNTLSFEAKDETGRTLSAIHREVWVPSPHFEKRPAKKVPLVYVFPRFLPSLERLAVIVDYTAWSRKVGYVGEPPVAEIRVWLKGQESDKPVLEGTLGEFEQNRGTWRHSTAALAEGEYTVKVTVRAPNGDELVVHDDWFEKRIFEWMTNPRGVGEAVPEPYTPLEVKDSSVRPWGRDYRFAANGLPDAMHSRDKPLLSGPVTFDATVNGRAEQVKATKRFRFRSTQPTEVQGAAELRLGGMTASVESVTEYDGLIRFRVTYGPARKRVTVNRLRLRVPLTGAYCRFYSASGDREGTNILGEVLPRTQGKLFDSQSDTYSVCGEPTFATLFWVADYDTYFCYAADSSKGWALRDDAPAVEVHRVGDDVILWLNLVDREIALNAPRTLEFALQTGPNKPLPKGWRGIQFEGNPADAPETLKQIAGGGFTLHGGPNFIHPGLTPEMRAKSRERIQAQSDGGRYTILGYHRWPAAVKGHPVVRVFRGEWGLDQAAWDAGRPGGYQWQKRFHGDDKDMHTMFLIKPVPSYVDYTAYAYDEALKETNLYGVYDDTGYPISVYDAELGLGYVRKDGRQVASSGLWVYRERWKRAAYVNFQRGRPNYTCDSQHVHAHFQPAYGFIGIWAPCERGFYNPFPDGDNLDFYKSLERYYAINPSHAFGQIPCAIGMSTPQGAFDLQARDTRCMMMLVLLHDQDLGSFGQRELRTMARLREARNVFRQWEEDVTFTGFWEEDLPVQVENGEFRLSLYRRAGSALLIIANVGDKPGRSRILPDWKALGIDAATARLAAPETGRELILEQGGFAVELARHDLQLVLAGDLNGYTYKPAFPGSELPRPTTVLAELSDPLRGPDLSAAWTVDVHAGNSGTGFVDGRFYVQTSHYGYGHVRRKLGVDNVSVQCLIMGRTTGQADEHCAGLGLWWENGSYARVIPGYSRHKFYYQVSGARTSRGHDIELTGAPGWYPLSANWVKIVLAPDVIRFLVSTDGKTWVQDHEVKRAPALGGAPVWAILGNGGAGGDQPLFKNTVAQHFKPERGDRVMVFSDFIVGRE